MKTNGNRKSKKTKTIKTNKIKSCNDFCKNMYVNEIDKQNKKLAKGSNLTYNSKTDRAFRISTCNNNFCNKNCENYKYYDKESEKLFKTNMKNNFITNMRPELIETIKINGAISYCDGFVYNPFNKNK